MTFLLGIVIGMCMGAALASTVMRKGEELKAEPIVYKQPFDEGAC